VAGGKEFQQSCNAEISVDDHARVIVTADVAPCSADAGQLLPLLDQAIASAGAQPRSVLADAG
jgi:hypothetical protein